MCEDPVHRLLKGSYRTIFQGFSILHHLANAILQGSDAVMLSEESARGKYPVEAVTMMEKIIIEAEKHMRGGGPVKKSLSCFP